jgi:hypothetical protein
MAGLRARIRSYWLETPVVPVDQEYCGESDSTCDQLMSKARVIESPVDAIELGSAGSVGAQPVALTVIAAIAADTNR